MKRAVTGLFVACALFSLTGCTSIAGHWNMESVKPESAKAQFNLASMCLAADGKYVACATHGSEMKKMSGTYTYDAGKKELTFKGDDGKERMYQAELVGSDEMKVSEKGKDWVAMMKKGECTCGKCDQKCEMKSEPKKAEPKKADAKKAEPAKKEKAKEAKPAGDKK